MVPFGGLLVAIGLIMAVAVADRVDGLDMSVAGWIITGVGAVMVVAGLISANAPRKSEHRIVEDTSVHTD